MMAGNDRGFSKKGKGVLPRRNNAREGDRKYLMLSKDKLDVFKYRLQDIVAKHQMDEKMSTPFIANILAKASRNSIFEAKDYITEKEHEGLIKPELSREIFYLLDRYSRMR